MSWMIPDHKLDPDQRHVIDLATKASRPMFIQGPAGSGKSISLVKVLSNTLSANSNLNVCMVLFTHSLIDMMRAGIPTVLLEKVSIFTAHDFFRKSGRWDLIIIDETQDIEEKVLKRVFKTGKKVLIAGDFSQSIYSNGCSPSYIASIPNLEQPLLKKIYRLPANIQKIAAFFVDNPAAFMSFEVDKRVANVTVQLIRYCDQLEEFKSVWKRAQEYARNGLATGVLFPENDTINRFCNAILAYERKSEWRAVYNYLWNRKRRYNYSNLNEHLRQQGLPLQVIGGGAGSMREADANSLVSALTYHSAKGLDFEAVFLPSLTREVIIWKDVNIAQRMFFVALTRSRRDLFLSYYGEPHEFIKRIPYHLISVCGTATETNSHSINNMDSVIDF